jgi:hypothetical protein
MARSRVRPELEELLYAYAQSRGLDITRESRAGHRMSQLRLYDSGYVEIDVWLSGKYHIVMTRYHEICPPNIAYVRCRKGERGVLPRHRADIGRFLDRVFFYADAVLAASIDKS